MPLGCPTSGSTCRAVSASTGELNEQWAVVLTRARLIRSVSIGTWRSIWTVRTDLRPHVLLNIFQVRCALHGSSSLNN